MTGFDLLHADARAVLDAWRPPDPAQAILAQEYLAHLRSYPLAMSRDNAPGHLTGSALVVDFRLEGSLAHDVTLTGDARLVFEGLLKEEAL